MLDVFSQPADGIQDAPHDSRLSAAGYQVGLRAIKLNCAHDRHTLTEELMMGLSVPLETTESWDALLDALTRPDQPERFGILLLGYRDFRYRMPRLSNELDATLTEAQRRLAAQGKQLYLLAAYPEADPRHF
ncbi:barstar family protein [Deinococcus sp. Marseille-Q6407]|uniref:barstar family protein n=1 Tax=Deinococcus sp. Marseille-Q6407 TaxID=2969223 RepID=UPI0021BFB906|nr:barstar family protein [Deinococcus sp. Marseille-Q6407]